MQRGQLIAAIVVVAATVGLLAVRFGGSDPVEEAVVVEPSAPTAGTEAEPADGDAAPAEAAPSVEEDPVDAPERLGPAGNLRGLDGWLQTDASDFSDFDGQVRIVQFWTFGCYNCKNTIPHLQAIYERWQPEGLEIIGVHSPEFDYEKDPEAIAVAAVDHGVVWPIALDTDKANFRRWQPGRRFWPRTFVIDQEGEIRFDHIGEGRYDELASTVAYLVENGP